MTDYLQQASFLHRQETERIEAARRAQTAEYRRRQRFNRMIDFSRGAHGGEVPVTFAADESCCAPGRVSGMLADRSTPLAAVICHPWGPMGGSMYDTHVCEMAGLLGVEGSITTLRFNFRYGIGRGRSSEADIRGACALLQTLDPPPRGILLCGYSYGACVVADAAPKIDAVKAFAMISPPLGPALLLFGGRDPMAEARGSPKPKLMIVGDRDQFCSTQRFAICARTLAEPKRCNVVTTDEVTACGDGCGHSHNVGVDHFSMFKRLADSLVPWVEETFGLPLASLGKSTGELQTPPQ